MKDYKKLYAVNIPRIKKLCPSMNERSGIYVFTRESENGIKHAYIGQAKNLLNRAAGHLDGYQRIDNSIRKRGLYDDIKNQFGWRLIIHCYCEIDKLDEKEQQTILDYGLAGFQLYNLTDGGQGEGKEVIGDNGRGGYRKGKAEGEKKAIKELATLIHKYTTGLTSKGGAIADRKTAELNNILKEKTANE